MISRLRGSVWDCLVPGPPFMAVSPSRAGLQTLPLAANRTHFSTDFLDTQPIIKEEPNSAQSRVQATSGPDWSQPRLRVSNETMEHEQSTYPTQKSSAHNLFADRSALPVDLPRLRPSRSVSIHIHTAASHLESAKRCGYLWTYKNNSFSINHLDFDTRGGGYTRYSMIRATTS